MVSTTAIFHQKREIKCRVNLHPTTLKVHVKFSLCSKGSTLGGVDFEKNFISKLYHFAIVVSMGRES
jgi:hypothetical protein